jgi:IS605 OrfB family transposase
VSLTDMHFTFEYGEVIASAEEKRDIDCLMRRYCSAKRTAFNDLLGRRSVKDATHRLETLGSLALNWRYCEHAARDASAELESQRELLPMYLSDTYDKIEDASSRLANAGVPRKRERMERTLLRLEKRKSILERHVADGTMPKVVFGTRRLFEERAKGKISSQEWREARDNQLYSIGQANQKGNANVRIDWCENEMGINFPERIEPRQAKGRVHRVKNTRRWFGMRANERFRGYVDSLRESGKAYSVRVVKKEGRYLAQVSFEIALPTADKAPEKVCSIDSNPEGFATAIVSRDGNLLAHRFFRDDRLVYAFEEKRDSVIGELVAKILAWGRDHGAEAFAIENLAIRGSRSFGRRANRVIYSFVRKKFAENLMMRCWKQGFPVDMVNPAYTSKIGGAKYREMYGLSVHEAAAFCIGRKSLGYGERLEEPMEITVSGKSNKRPSERVPVRYVWGSIYSYHHPVDLRMEPPGRKGSAGERRGGGNEAVFTGRPASERTPLSESDEGVRKGRGCGGSPQATGDGVKPAPSDTDGGKVAAASLLDM